MKTEELNALGLNEEQVQKVFAMHGAEMNDLKQQVTTLTAERDAARTQLGEANNKLEGYDPEWKNKAQQAQQQADRKVQEMKSRYAEANAAAGIKFTSAGARKAFLDDLARTCRCRKTVRCLGLTTTFRPTKRMIRAPLLPKPDIPM